MKSSLTIMAVLLLAQTAYAYESLCRTSGDITGLDSSVCSFSQTYECAPGLEAARGRMLGEHTRITLDAMINAGLPSEFASAQPAIPQYYAPQATITLSRTHRFVNSPLEFPTVEPRIVLPSAFRSRTRAGWMPRIRRGLR